MICEVASGPGMGVKNRALMNVDKIPQEKVAVPSIPQLKQHQSFKVHDFLPVIECAPSWNIVINCV